ncbi:tetratricopeptide repeat protein [Paenibacillus solani]|uniref:Lipoprotein n=1 Tax=Paenibacillus solani TaxID=1705565 RepID=A0A0M1P269_9BACL|nr:hypothetical protein [Paenibacillus solani]KOR88487.1 hypothetical protein AM231_04535 [Paenibacillus solani]
MKGKTMIFLTCLLLLLLISGCGNSKQQLEKYAIEKKNLTNRISDLEDQRAYLEEELKQAMENLSPEVLYNVAKQYADKDREKAKSYLLVLIDQFPSSEQAKKARDLIGNVK